MPSEELELLIAGYVLGDLDASEMVEFEQMLAENPAIGETVAQMQKALELSYAPPEIAPPAHLRSAILAASNLEPEVSAASTPEFTSPGSIVLPERQISERQTPYRAFSWNKAWSVAAALLVAILGINNYRLWQTLQATQTETQSSTSLTYTLHGTEPGNPAAATLVVNPDRLNAELTIKDLPPPPPGKTYVLWTVLQPNAPFTVDDKNAVLTEVLRLNDQGYIEETIVVPEVYRSSQFVAKVAITLEDATAPQAHVGSPILITGL